MPSFISVECIYPELHRLGYIKIPFCMTPTTYLFSKALSNGIAHFEWSCREEGSYVVVFFKQNNKEKTYLYSFPVWGLASFEPIENSTSLHHIFETTDEAVEHLIATLAAQ
jgi:hypothetical protein